MHLRYGSRLRVARSRGGSAVIDWFMFHPLTTLTPMGLGSWVIVGWWVRGGYERWNGRER